MTMLLQKTERARAELQPGVRTLGQRERTLLLMADGVRQTVDFRQLFNGEGEQIALRLLRDGFLEPCPQQAPAAAPAPAPAPVLAAPAVQAQSAPVPPTGDTFEGKRSLATTRMFLFDLCERMFARKDPALANHFRDALRSARDRETMLTAARLMLEKIAEVAGTERADSIGERIALLLPHETLDTPESVVI